MINIMCRGLSRVQMSEGRSSCSFLLMLMELLNNHYLNFLFIKKY